MDTLKEALTIVPALTTIQYPQPLENGLEIEVGEIILAMDASGTGWGAVLMQVDPGMGKCHPACFESGVWSTAEQNYDMGKKECWVVLLALKKFRSYLYGVHFTLEVDAATLVAQLN